MEKMVYLTGMYKRISQEDDGGSSLSNSIINQDKLIRLYVNNHHDLKIVREYIDDGVSGVGFDRPGFSQMMKDIDDGIINCVIVKDLSRFGRNHYECDRYMQEIFPQKGVRFIAINDNYDSNNETSDTDMFLVPIKNIINDNYCRDISIKVRSQLDTKRKLGECVKNFAPYGYSKDSKNKNRLIIDEYAAFVVKEIFCMKLKGYSAQAIADELNNTGIKSPSEYKKSHGSRYCANLQQKFVAKWCASEIRNILTLVYDALKEKGYNPINQIVGYILSEDPTYITTHNNARNLIRKILTDITYCGKLAQGRMSKPTFKCKRAQPVSKEKWIVVENTHEAIVSTVIFEAVERSLDLETRIAPSQKTVYPLSGMVKCGRCGGKMNRKMKSNKYGTYYYLICNNKLKSECDMPMLPYGEAEKIVLKMLQLHIETMVDVYDFVQNQDVCKISSSMNEMLLYDINEKKKDIRALEDSLIFLHSKHIEGVLADDEFSRLRKIKSANLDKLEKELKVLEKKQQLSCGTFSDKHSWVEVFREYKNIDSLKREAVALFIKGIRVFPDKRIEVSFAYASELDEMVRLASILNKTENLQLFAEGERGLA